MRKLLLIASLLLPSLLWGAVTYPSVGFEIETNGWVLRWTLMSDNALGAGTASTNAGFFNGLGTNNSLSLTTAVVVSMTEMGYNTSGQAIQRPRTLYGTKLLRLTYPLQNTNDIIAENGTNIVLRLALSGFVTQYTSNITVTATLGAIATTNSGIFTNSAAVTAATVTNSSTQFYPVVIGNRTRPDRNRETNVSMRLSAIGFHGWADSVSDGTPLACVKFIVTDEHSNKITNTVTRMSIDKTLPDLLPAGEYISDFTLNTFTNLDALRCDYVFFPHYGNSAAVLDTTTTPYGGVTGLPSPGTNVCDRSRVESVSSYSETFAVVDPAGNDTNGRATNNVGGPISLNSALYFLSIAKAANQCAATNNAIYGHNDVGGAIIYVRAGVTNWLGASSTYGNIPRCNITIMPYPGDTVTLTNQANNNDISDCIRLYRCGLGGPNSPAGALFNNTDFLWLDQCTINTPGTQFFQGSKSTWLTHNTISALVQGIAPIATKTDHYMLRGNNLSGFNNKIVPQLAMGNIHFTTNGGDYFINSEVSGQGGQTNKYLIWYNNFWGGFKDNADCSTLGAVSGVIEGGCADVQNIYEFCTNNTNPNLTFIGTLNTVQYTNVIYWHNLLTGKRSGFGYNDSGTAPSYKYLWSGLNNIGEIIGWKTDTFGTPNAARIGNWPLIWQVGWSGNLDLEFSFDQGFASFPPEFDGMNSYRPRNNGTNLLTWIKYTDRKSWDGTSSGNPGGGGNYRLLSESPAFKNMKTAWVLPYDFNGWTRSAIDPPGPYSTGNPYR